MDECCLCGRGRIKGIKHQTFSLLTLIDSMNDVRDSKAFQEDLGILTAKMVLPTTTYKNIITALKDDLVLNFNIG